MKYNELEVGKWYTTNVWIEDSFLKFEKLSGKTCLIGKAVMNQIVHKTVEWGSNSGDANFREVTIEEVNATLPEHLKIKEEETVLSYPIFN